MQVQVVLLQQSYAMLKIIVDGDGGEQSRSQCCLNSAPQLKPGGLGFGVAQFIVVCLGTERAPWIVGGLDLFSLVESRSNWSKSILEPR